MAVQDYKGVPMKDIRGYMTEEEVKKVIDATAFLRDKLLLRLLWVTGARISEIVGDKSWYKNRVFYGLRVEDILWKESVVILDTLKRKQYPPPKRRVTLDARTLEMLRAYVTKTQLAKESKVFNITRQRAWQIVKELATGAGIKKVGLKPPHPHHLRHSSCVAFIRHNNTMEGLRKLQQKLKHANIQTTAHYLQFAPEEQEEVEDVFGKW